MIVNTGSKARNFVVSKSIPLPEKVFVFLDTMEKAPQMTFRDRVACALNEYDVNAYLSYDFERYSTKDFVSLNEIRTLRDQMSELDRKTVDDKSLFYERVITETDLQIAQRMTDNEAREHIQNGGSVIAKPQEGLLGDGIVEVKTLSELSAVSSDEELILTEKLPCNDWMPTWADAVGSTRIVVARSSSHESFEYIGAIQKSPTENSYPVDNWAGGGVSIGVSNGFLCEGMLKPKDTIPGWITSHPDTDEEFSGIEIPNFKQAIQQAEQTSNQLFDQARIIGWDFVIYEDRIVVLEANGLPDVHMMQIHEPFETDMSVFQK